MSGPRRGGRRGRCFCAVAVLFRLSLLCSLCCDLGDRGSGAGFVDDRLVAGVGGDEGLDGEVVHRGKHCLSATASSRRAQCPQAGSTIENEMASLPHSGHRAQ